jgi:hypothetical protein
MFATILRVGALLGKRLYNLPETYAFPENKK